METVSTKDKQQQAAIPYFKGFLDQIRANSDKIEQILDGISYIEGKAEAVREKLEHDFYAAVMAQRDALVSGDEEDQRLADEVSLLAFSEGRNNQYLPAHEYPKQMRARGYVSGNELKVLQAQKMLTTLHSIIEDPSEDDEDKAEASLRIDAVNRYIDTTPLAEIMNTGDGGENGGGNIVTKNTDKLTAFGRRVVAAVGLSALALIGTANTSHAAQKSSIDDESYDPNDMANQKNRRFAAPIKLAAPVDGKIEPPVRVEASPPSARRPDGSIKLATPTVIEPPTRIEASPNPNITTIPNAPVKPPAAPAPAIEKAPAGPIPEVIINPDLAGETLWTKAQLEQVRANFGVYHEVEKETGVPWEVMAALHVREFGLQRANPANGQGIYQLYSTGIYFAPGPVAEAEFKQQTILAANFLLGKAKDNSRVGGPLALNNPDKIKDTLFSYNGRAAQYFEQAARLGYALGAEGSPYVMNLADDKRNSNLNPNWGQILVDNGPLGRANQAPGAWPLIEGLIKINKIAHEQAAKDAATANADKNATTASQHEQNSKPATIWHNPIPEGAKMTSPFGPRGGGGMHWGEDFGVETGAPFLAATDGKVSVIVVDVRSDATCQNALANIGFPMANIKDPIQKEVYVTTVIDGDEYVTVYAHLSEVLVAPGQIVKAGEVVGKTGGSGCSTGDHAHFEVRKNGVPINPATVLPR